MRVRGRVRGSAAFAGVALLAVMALTTGAGPASAAGETSNATGLIFNGGRTAPADCPPGGSASNPGGTFGLVTVGALTANCTNTSASASAASVTVGTLTLGVVQSQCTVGDGGSSSVVVISGLPGVGPGVISTPLTVNLGLITVALNEVTTGGGFVTVNALRITALGQTIIVAQSRCSNAAYPLAVDVAERAVARPDVPAVTSGLSSMTKPPVWLAAMAVLTFLVAAQTFSLGGVLGGRRGARR